MEKKPIFKGQHYKKIPLFLSIMNERNIASIQVITNVTPQKLGVDKPVSSSIQSQIIRRLTLQSLLKTKNTKPKGYKYMHFINNHITTSGLKHYKNPTKDKEQKKNSYYKPLKLLIMNV